MTPLATDSACLFGGVLPGPNADFAHMFLSEFNAKPHRQPVGLGVGEVIFHNTEVPHTAVVLAGGLHPNPKAFFMAIGHGLEFRHQLGTPPYLQNPVVAFQSVPGHLASPRRFGCDGAAFRKPEAPAARTKFGRLQTPPVARKNGAPIYVRDLASVRLTYKDPLHVVRQRGAPCIAVNAVRETGTNVLEIMAGLREAVEELNEELLHPRGFTLFQVYDETDYIYSSLSLVQQNLIVGSILAITVLYLFLRTGSTTLVIGLAIPISIMGTFITLWLLGRNLNVISLAGMTFAAGMLVDNSIVVLENIYRHRELGKPLSRAAYDGTVEVWGAVLASTLTTIAVFVPIVFVEEQAGQLFRDIAIAISAGVGLSLLVSITVIPSLSARILTIARQHQGGGTGKHSSIREQVDGWLHRGGILFERVGIHSGRFADFVYWLCGTTFRRLVTVIGLTLLAVVITVMLFPRAEYLPTGNRNLIIGILLPPPGYNTDEFLKMGETIEAVLRPYWEVQPGSPEEAALDGPGIRNFFYVASGRRVFMGARTNQDERVKELILLFRRATADLPGVISIVTQSSLFQRGLGEGRNIDIEITGPEISMSIFRP